MQTEPGLEIKPEYYFEPGGVPVFKPSMEEFQDFKSFVLAIESYGLEAGLVKIIPPKEWFQLIPTSIERIQKLLIKRPIMQEFNCGGLPAGSQRQFNIETKKVYSVEQWYHLCQSDQHHSPLMDPYTGKMALVPKRKKCSKKDDDDSDDEQQKDVNYLQTPDYYTIEYMTALERFYWRNVSFQETMYGADMPGSIFTNNPENKWNVSRLENLLNQYPDPIPGVNLPYLYFGMYKSTFAWHVEDMDLPSINYIHFGAPKQWYVVPPAHRARFERYSAGLFYDESKKCPEFLRHKTCVISPDALLKQNIPVNKLIQNAGEFVITFPGGYHQGYNAGFNCAESVNFAFDSWIPFGRKAKSCKCEKDSVKMNIDLLLISTEKISDEYKDYYINADMARYRQKSKQTVSQTLKKKNASNPKPIIVKPVLPAVKCELCIKGNSDRFPLHPTTKGKVAHKECGLHILETFVEKKENSIMIGGIENIPTARWRLKCNICKYDVKVGKSFTGACIQCTTGKCKRAYHVTCAMEINIPVFLEDGILICHCPQHDPNLRQERKLKLMDDHQKQISTLEVGAEVTCRYNGLFYFAKIQEIVPEKNGCILSFDDSDQPCFVEWAFIRPIPQRRAMFSNPVVPYPLLNIAENHTDEHPSKKVKLTDQAQSPDQTTNDVIDKENTKIEETPLVESSSKEQENMPNNHPDVSESTLKDKPLTQILS